MVKILLKYYNQNFKTLLLRVKNFRMVSPLRNSLQTYNKIRILSFIIMHFWPLIWIYVYAYLKMSTINPHDKGSNSERNHLKDYSILVQQDFLSKQLIVSVTLKLKTKKNIYILSIVVLFLNMSENRNYNYQNSTRNQINSTVNLPNMRDNIELFPFNRN